LVVTLRVVCVVPAARLAAGAVMVTEGGVVSAGVCVVALAAVEALETLPAASVALTVYVYCVAGVRFLSWYERVVTCATAVALPFLKI